MENPSVAHESDVMRKQSNINVRAAVIHVLGDLIQSIGVFIAAIVIKFNVSIIGPFFGFFLLSSVVSIY